MCGDKVKENTGTDKESIYNKKPYIYVSFRLSIDKKDVIRILT